MQLSFNNLLRTFPFVLLLAPVVILVMALRFSRSMAVDPAIPQSHQGEQTNGFLGQTIVVDPAHSAGEAALARTINQMDQIVEKRGMVSSNDSKAQTPLFAAIEAQDRKLYLQLLASGADPNRCNPKGVLPVHRAGLSAMHRAAEEADVFWLQEALAHGGDPNVRTDDNSRQPGRTPLFAAVASMIDSENHVMILGRMDNVTKLIAAGADVNAKDRRGWVLCCEACGNYEIVIKLLEAGADPKQVGVGGSLIDWFAVRHDALIDPIEQIPWFRVARQMLIKRGVLEDKPPVSTMVSAVKRRAMFGAKLESDEKGESTLFRAIEAKNKAAYLRLLESGVDPNICDVNDYNGISVLHLAAQKDDVFWMREALAHGGNPNHTTDLKFKTGWDKIENPFSNTPPIVLAVNHWQLHNVVELLEAGAAVDPLWRGVQTPCGKAADRGNYEMVVTFLNAGADAKLARKRRISLIQWFEERDERYVGRESQIPWYRKARAILIKQGHLKK